MEHPMPEFTHLDGQQNPRMVDVGGKVATPRLARARAYVRVSEEILARLEHGDIQTAKGAVFQTAVIAGIMAAKKTGELIPLCHPLGLHNCQVHISLSPERDIQIDTTASLHAATGVEMEALTAASVAALTIYDMCKAFSPEIVIREIKLMEKRGGKRDYRREEP
jgi:cyclic pyranopterin monophosphate synthase